MKTTRRTLAQLCLLLAVPLFFFSCEKDEEQTGQGNYIYAINNFTNASHEYNVYLDGQYKGKIRAASGTYTIFSDLCANIASAENQENMLVMKSISIGHHTLKLEDTATLSILHTENFTLERDGCMGQPYTML